MRFFLLLAAIAVLTAPRLYAQEERMFRQKFTNLSFTAQKLDLESSYVNDKINSKYGAAITTGRTYYVHKAPLLGMVRFAIDAAFLDLNYAHYSAETSVPHYYDSYEYGTVEDVKFHQAEIGVQVGPSVTVNPISKLNVQAYFRFSPTYAALYDDFAGEIYGTYASFFVCGGAVSFGGIGLGVESRWGTPKYGALGFDDFKAGDDKFKTTATRVFLTLRF